MQNRYKELKPIIRKEIDSLINSIASHQHGLHHDSFIHLINEIKEDIKFEFYHMALLNKRSRRDDW